MRIQNNRSMMKALCGGLPWLALLLVLGCEPGARREVTVRPPTTTPIAPAPVPPVPPVPAAAPVDVAQETGGFTITQRVPVSDQVRADYEAAGRKLKDAQYEQGIALLVK